ncbi:Ribonuclease H-like superfamily protein [Rhynchospora pubera]|uniref:Ribonuclease H-like superfamily protein n=1 Tax=Rhynchospora pubera TaxID=906938 RepID=A0AAV8CJ57_9POAL|nr:Ribonuclease H-like superfamily protein [Rhynchospora pubera]
MWRWKGIIPKVKVFIWRLLSKTLPVAQNMHKRINAFSPMCQRCGTENEFETHCMFFCPISWLVWFGGRMGIATHALPMNIEEAFIYITNGIDDEGKRYVCYTLWEIWLARNQEIFHQKRADPIDVWRKVNQHMNIQVMANEWGPQMGNSAVQNVGQKMLIENWIILMDASCDGNGQAGMAFLVYNKGYLVSVGVNHKTGVDPFWAEALVLEEVMKCIQETMDGDVRSGMTLLTNCLNLVDAIKEQDVENIPSWRARDTVAKILEILNLFASVIQIKHVNREIIRPAHVLANNARRKRLNYRSQPNAHMNFLIPEAIVLDSKFFLQLQDRPP